MRKIVWMALLASLALPSRTEADPRAPSSARADTLFARREWAAAASAYRDLARADAGSGRAWLRLGWTTAGRSPTTATVIW